MADRPGYFKPQRRRSREPKSWVICHGELVKRLVRWIPATRVSDLNPNNPSMRRVSPAGWLVSAVICTHKRSKKRKRVQGRKRIKTAFSRLRERNPTLERFGNLPPNHRLGKFKIYQNSQVLTSSDLKTTGAYAGAITSERSWDQLNPGPPFQQGGPFACVKSQVPGPGLTPSATYRSVTFSPGSWWEYTGGFVDNGEWLGDSTSNYIASAVPQVSGYDSLAWDKLKPRVAEASAAQFLAELRDLPRMLETSANLFHNSWRSFGGGYSTVTMHPRSVADNFLNHNFGWAPFIGDLGKFLKVYQDQNRLIANRTRDNGQWVRRRAVLDSKVTETVVGKAYLPGVEPFGFQIQGLCNDMTVDGITCKGYMEIREVIETKTWAVGHFMFYRPEFDVNNPGFGTLLMDLQRLMSLYGLRINPSLVYKLTPYSWAVDWASSLGSHLERLDDFVVDGIVSRGLYIMQSMRRMKTKTSVINFASGARTFQWKRELSTKVRKVADSPYGFNRPWNNLTPRQLAILAAVGISRSDSGFISRGA